MIARRARVTLDSMSSSSRCLVTGATGYIGGRLVPELLSAGYAVRCMARDPGKLSDRPWSDQVEVAAADATDESAVRRALQGVDVAYYLIHSLATAAKAAGVPRPPGPSAGCSTGWPAGSDCAAGAAIPGICSPAMPWISGGWRRSSRDDCCGCARR